MSTLYVIITDDNGSTEYWIPQDHAAALSYSLALHSRQFADAEITHRETSLTI